MVRQIRISFWHLNFLNCLSNTELSFCKVYELMLRDERFYPSFKQHALYVRMLAELDMLKDPSFRGSDDGEGGKLTLELTVICV